MNKLVMDAGPCRLLDNQSIATIDAKAEGSDANSAPTK